MPRIYLVPSSNVKAIGYDSNTRELVVEFPGGWYSYSEVPPTQVVELMFAESVGKYLNAAIKPNYEVKRLSDDEVTALMNAPEKASI
jgi:hypothetical protein